MIFGAFRELDHKYTYFSPTAQAAPGFKTENCYLRETSIKRTK